MFFSLNLKKATKENVFKSLFKLDWPLNDFKFNILLLKEMLLVNIVCSLVTKL